MTSASRVLLTKGAFPAAPLLALDTVWFQVAGTVCNLQCTHCFISCSPTNHTHEMLDLETVQGFLREAAELGVREYYFTGGEPFLNLQIFDMIEAALLQGPVSVLTNGVLLTGRIAGRLKALDDASPYSLDMRISIDGWDAETNDPIRGAGTFRRILAGIGHLAAARLSPVLTVTEACEGARSAAGRARFLAFLADIGLPHPRLKILPLLRLGAETSRERGYAVAESLRGVDLSADDLAALQCTTSRMVTARGVYVCPILIDSPQARMGDTLRATMRPFALGSPACHTCHTEGLSCRT